MISWKLFTHVLVAWDAYNNPVFIREAEHPPVWHMFVQRLVLMPGFRTGMTGTGVFLWLVGTLYVNNLLFFLLPPLIVLIFTTSLTLGPLVATERVRRSWEPLLTIPIGIEMVLMGKVGGALWWIRHLLFFMAALMVAISSGVGFINLVLLPTGAARSSEWAEFILCGGVLLLPIIGGAVFLIDRAQQYLLMVTAALTAGTLATSVRTALSNATTAVLLVWFFETALGIALSLQFGAGEIPNRTYMLALITLGPTVSYILEMNPVKTVGYTLITLVGRELLINLLWWLALRFAQPEGALTAK